MDIIFPGSGAVSRKYFCAVVRTVAVSWGRSTDGGENKLCIGMAQKSSSLYCSSWVSILSDSTSTREHAKQEPACGLSSESVGCWL